MELRHLRYFVAVAEELHFTRAAERLGMSQPPLSQQIRELEEELQARLLERTSRQVALTEAGRLFLVEARSTLAQADRARLVAGRAHRGEIGELAVGMFPSALLVEPVADVILGFRRLHPRVRLVLLERAAQAAMHDLADRSVEAAFLRDAARPDLPAGFALTEVMREPMVLVVHRDHRLAGSERPVPTEALAAEPFIHVSPGSDSALHDHVAALCAEAGFVPRVEQEAGQDGTILALIGAGIGLSILPQSLCRLRLPQLRIVPLASPAAVSRIWLAYRRRGAGPLLRALVSLMTPDAGKD